MAPDDHMHAWRRMMARSLVHPLPPCPRRPPPAAPPPADTAPVALADVGDMLIVLNPFADLGLYDHVAEQVSKTQ